MLRFCRFFVKIYIDDVIIFSKIENEHLHHLKQIFKIFKQHNILIKSIKIFITYSSIRLLKQKVNFLNLITDENKFRVINNFKFSIIFRQLEHYFDLTDWLWNYVEKYVKITESLKNKKIVILKKLSFNVESTRRIFSIKIVLQNSTEAKKKSFWRFQIKLFSFQYLIHCSPQRQLYMNVDVNKKKHKRYDLSFKTNDWQLFVSFYDRVNHVFQQTINWFWNQILIHWIKNSRFDLSVLKNTSFNWFNVSIADHLYWWWSSRENQSSENSVHVFDKQTESSFDSNIKIHSTFQSNHKT